MRRIEPSFEVMVPDGEEANVSVPGDFLAVANCKHENVLRRAPHALIIAADTGVFLEGEHLGKPVDTDQARAYLKALSGRWHSVFTGLVVSRGGEAREALVETRVRFRPLSEEEIDWYVVAEDVLDKAGAYAIQGQGAVLVERVDGDYANVMGLPLAKLYCLMRELGWQPPRPERSADKGA